MGGALGDGEFEVFLEIHQVPVHVGVLWPTAEAARSCGRGDIRLAFDRRSGFIANVAFDEARVDYTLRYDNALHFSPYFREYEDSLAKRLVDRYALREKEIIEIGTGGGRFLGILCELGNNRGTGFDPSHDPEKVDERAKDRVEIVRDHYSERYADRPADLICFRHVLEHLPSPSHFLAWLRRTLDAHPDCVLYCEVPNSYLILRELSVWDLIYEHCGYFVPESLRAVFETAGFEVLDLYEAYGGQFVAIEVRPARKAKAQVGDCDVRALSEAVERFPDRFAAKRGEWQERMSQLRAEGRHAVVWGGGAKAVSFFSLLEIGDQIEYVVDINPGKQGSHLAGSGLPIVAPDFLRGYRPDLVIVMNPLYKPEIDQQLGNLGLSTETVTV